MVVEFGTQRTAVRTEAQRQRDRLEAQAKEARERLAREAREAQDRIRKQQSEAEREAEVAKARAREAERLEQRKRDLPFTRPSPLGTAGIITGIEERRKKVHSEGGKVRGEIETEKKKGQAEVEKQKAEAQAEVEKWEKENLAKIAKAEQEYKAEVARAEREAEKAREVALARPGKEVFDELVASGDIPKGAIYKSYNKKTGEVKYEVEGKPITTTEDVRIVGYAPTKNEVIIKFASGAMEWRPASEFPDFDKLTKSQKEEAVLTGKYTLPPVVLTGQEAFEQMVTSGDIPKSATFESYNKKTGEVTYLLPAGYLPPLTPKDVKEVEQSFLAEPRYGQKNIINAALERKPIGVGITAVPPPELKYGDLTAEQQQKVVQRYATLTGKEKVLWAIPLPKALEPHKEFIEGMIGLVPALGTAYFWNRMSPTWKAISIIIDVAIFLPAFKAAYLGIAAKARPLQTAVKALIRSEATFNKLMAKQISKSYGKVAATNFKAVNTAQMKYIRQLAKLDILQSAKKPNLAKIKIATNQAEKTARDLEAIASKYAKSIKGKAGFDSPAIAKMIDDLPREMTRNIRSAVASLKSTETTIKVLKANVIRAEATLKAAQAKHPTDPSKWADLMANHALAQSKLESALAGNTTDLYADLLKTRESLARATTTATKTKAQAEVYRLEDKVRRALRSMDIEWGRGGMLTTGRGGVATVVKPPPTRIIGVPSKPAVAKPTPIETYPAAVAMLTTLRIAHNLSGAEVAKVEPMVVETIKAATEGLTNSEVIKATEKITAKAIQEAINLKVSGYTQAEINAQIKPAIQAQVDAIIKPALKAQVQPKVALLTKLAIKTAVRVTTKIRIIPRPIITLPSGEKRPMTKEEFAGAVAWKQGFIYIMIYPPYGKDNIEHSRKPFPGVRTTKGARSAYETIVRIGGKIPASIKRDMGIMDVEITTPKVGKPVIRFKADIKQRTRLTPRRRKPKAGKQPSGTSLSTMRL